MRSSYPDRGRVQGLGSRLLGGRVPLQIVVGAVAIAAIVLALAFRPGQSAEEAKPTSVPRPTVAPAAVTALPMATATPVPVKERTHVVASGDTLTSIAEKYYGDASKWQKVFEANKDVLPNANSLQIGQKLKIPD